MFHTYYYKENRKTQLRICNCNNCFLSEYKYHRRYDTDCHRKQMLKTAQDMFFKNVALITILSKISC